jgi:type IV pilus biogenesis protein CpaD/CtpE
MYCDILNVARRRGAVLRRPRPADRRAWPAALTGCNTTTAQDTTGGIPKAYRERHPIALKEGKKTLGAGSSAPAAGGLAFADAAGVAESARPLRRELEA